MEMKTCELNRRTARKRNKVISYEENTPVELHEKQTTLFPNYLVKLPSHSLNHSCDFTLVLVLLGQTFQLIENAVIWHRISTEQTHQSRQQVTQVAKLWPFLPDKRKLITHYLEIYAAKQWFPVLPGNHHHCPSKVFQTQRTAPPQRFSVVPSQRYGFENH